MWNAHLVHEDFDNLIAAQLRRSRPSQHFLNGLLRGFAQREVDAATS